MGSEWESPTSFTLHANLCQSSYKLHCCANIRYTVGYTYINSAWAWLFMRSCCWQVAQTAIFGMITHHKLLLNVVRLASLDNYFLKWFTLLQRFKSWPLTRCLCFMSIFFIRVSAFITCHCCPPPPAPRWLCAPSAVAVFCWCCMFPASMRSRSQHSFIPKIFRTVLGHVPAAFLVVKEPN